MRNTPKIIRFARHGCANRPFFHIVVMEVSNLLQVYVKLRCKNNLIQNKSIRLHI
jgi:hypothetical protein